MSDPEQRQRYREVISHFATGVSIVTADGQDGPSGLTANALCSLSLDPLMLLVCLENSARTLPLVRDAERFGVNILAHEQHAMSGVFASKVSEQEKFKDVLWARHGGVPVISGALAWLACELRELHPGGDHTIAIGAVIDMDHNSDGQPLLWYRGRYGVFSHATPAEARLI
jgi:3-hydroxy-9,10-secoandrosta-1,3,5(10)-triene-9,17-dione monooxygenase reductase component